MWLSLTILSILSRLESAGWSREEITAAQRCSSDVEDFPLLTYHPVFRECRPLTDDGSLLFFLSKYEFVLTPSCSVAECSTKT
jgi:hypothetical protein